MASSFTTTKAYLIDLFVICILYGIYLSMFVASLSVLRRCNGSELQCNAFVRRTLVVVAWIICILETASVIFNLLRCMNHFVDDSVDRVHTEAVGIGIVSILLVSQLEALRNIAGHYVLHSSVGRRYLRQLPSFLLRIL
jgi:hypothetical protein